MRTGQAGRNAYEKLQITGQRVRLRGPVDIYKRVAPEAVLINTNFALV
jgi:hypothetical protein